VNIDGATKGCLDLMLVFLEKVKMNMCAIFQFL